MNTVTLGRQGEEKALRILKDNGYQIIARNVRSRFGEIDLVARDGRTLCFVEIKARTSIRFGFPEEGVSRVKQRRLIRLAQWYLQRYRLNDSPVRFDVVSLLLDSNGAEVRTRLIKGAFDASGFSLI